MGGGGDGDGGGGEGEGGGGDGDGGGGEGGTYAATLRVAVLLVPLSENCSADKGGRLMFLCHQ